MVHSYRSSALLFLGSTEVSSHEVYDSIEDLSRNVLKSVS